jgi:4-amino-4-deoxy-L-arabinose transferase-like glycosyltransferase
MEPSLATCQSQAAESFSAGKFLRVVLWVVLFLGVHLLLRLLASPSLHKDEAELLIFNQSLAWGYSEQPPLFIWTFYFVSQGVGATLLSVSLFRSILLGCTVLLVYLTTLQILRNHSRARLAAFSLLLISLFAWHSLIYLTHSILFGFLAILTCYLAVRIIQRPRWWDYVCLGVVIALGGLSKYNYTIFLASLVGAGLTIPAIRIRLLDRRILLTGLIALVLILPHALWLIANLHFVQGVYDQKLHIQDAKYFLGGLLPWGAVTLLINMVLLGGLAVGCMIGLSPRGFLWAKKDEPVSRMYELWLGRFFVVVGGIYFVYALVKGAGEIHERWLEPFFVVLPIYLFCRLGQVELAPAALRRYWAVLIFLAVGFTLARCGQLFFPNTGFRGDNSTDYSFARAAAQLRPVDSKETVLVTFTPGLGGNLRQHLPEMGCVCSTHRAYRPPQVSQASRYIVLWEDPHARDIPPYLRDFLKSGLNMPMNKKNQVHKAELEGVVPGCPAMCLSYVILEVDSTK